jgi:hypothetical protein
VDEVLPPSFLADERISRLGGSMVEKSKVLLSIKHSSAKIEHIWGAGNEHRDRASLSGPVETLLYISPLLLFPEC